MTPPGSGQSSPPKERVSLRRAAPRARGPALAAGLLLAALLPAGRAYGSGQTWLGASLERIVSAARGKLGPVRYNLAFRVENAGYDSDIYFGMRPNQAPDYTFSVCPDVGLYIPLTKKIVLGVFEVPRYVYFLENDGDRALNNAFQAQIHFDLGSLYLQAGGAMTDAKERASTEFQLNVRRKENEVRGLAFWQIGQGTALALRYRWVSMRYDNPTQEATDIRSSLSRRESHVNFTAYLAQISRSRLYIDAEQIIYRPEDSLSTFRESRSYGLYGGIEFVPEAADKIQSRTLQGRINLGYKRFSVPNSPFADLEGLVANTFVKARIFKQTSVRADFTRNVQFSAYSALGYYLLTNAGAGLTHSLSRTVELSYLFSAIRHDYAETGEATGPPRRDTILMHTMRLNVRLAENLGLDISVNLNRRSSNLSPQAYRRQSLGFSLVYGSIAGQNVLEQSPFSQ
jgi:hypothetical protein